MLAVAADEARADRSETTERDVAHRRILVDVTVRTELYVTQSAPRINGGTIVETRIKNRTAIFYERSFTKRRAQDVTVLPNLDLFALKTRLHHTRPKPDPDVPIPALILRMKNQAFKILNQIGFIRG